MAKSKFHCPRCGGPMRQANRGALLQREGAAYICLVASTQANPELRELRTPEQLKEIDSRDCDQTNPYFKWSVEELGARNGEV